MKTPIVFLIFNRPDTTIRVFEAIRQAKPQKLLVVADGPRIDKPGEAEKCAAVRSIIDIVDWDCEVLTNFSDINLGCKKRVSSGLDWVFSLVEEAIILEDDCLPNPTFFRFCQELLEKYRDDKSIMTIGGSNLLRKWKSDRQSYHFSYYFSCWGWATWKRTWDFYDVNMNLWSDENIRQNIREIIADDRQFFYIKKELDITYTGRKNTWDYQLFFQCLMRQGFSILPSTNLISNIGCGTSATNTVTSKDVRANMPTYPMNFPLIDPLTVTVDRQYAYRHYKKVWDNSISSRVLRKVKCLLRG